MMVPARARRWAGAGAALAIVLGVSARAEAHGEDLIPFALAAALLPSEAGVDVATRGGTDTSLLLGWSWQVPLGHDDPVSGAASPHRVVGGVDLIRGANDVSGRARLGYRFAFHDLLVGPGLALDSRGLSFSPELGFNLVHVIDDVAALHVLARAQVDAGGFRGAAFTLGWTFL